MLDDITKQGPVANVTAENGCESISKSWKNIGNNVALNDHK